MTSTLADTVSSLMGRARDDLAELVAFRSIADPDEAPPEECAKAAQWVVDAFTDAGIQDVRTYTTSDGSDAVAGYTSGPPGTPTVLLYSHYDVQPPLGDDEWTSPVWELTERDGRWYGRGAADCKGNVIMHLTALRALRERDGGFPCGIKIICEGSEEQGTGGLEEFVPPNADLLRADTILVVDVGNFAVGVPTLTTTLRGMSIVDVRLRALSSAVHSGMFGGPAPDPIAGLIAMLASLTDADGNVTVDGVDATQTWPGSGYDPDAFRADATVRDGVGLIGSGSVADHLWARPAVTVLGIDAPRMVGATASIQPTAGARVSLRVPPGMDAEKAQEALVAHLRARVPWNLQCELTPAGVGQPFAGSLDGPGFDALKASMEEAFGGAELITVGEGGSIPLCNVLHQTFPQAEIMLLGVEEPKCLIHAPNESVDPGEIERIALAEALFLQRYGATFKA
jgi:acetylornithine deacetylase/succinyl-diaminopimelate desuccinylase-like protein